MLILKKTMPLFHRAQSRFLVALLFAFFLLSCIPGRSPAATSEDQNFLRVPIERQIAGDRTNRTPYAALIRVYQDAAILPDIWVPAELLRDMNIPAKLNEKKDTFTVRVKKPADALGVTAIKQLAPEYLDLDFPARSEDNGQYLNLTGMVSVTDLNCRLIDGKRNAVLSPGSADLLIVGKRSLLPDAAAIKIEKPAAEKPAQSVKPESKKKKPLVLVWDHIIKENPDLSAEDLLPGVIVISPTWFALADEGGGVSNKGNVSYVQMARAKEYRVWALVSNSFKRDRTTKFLASKKAQDVFIARLLAYAKLYGFEGINVDFESVDNKDAAKLTAFVKRLATAARTMGLSISIDIMIPTKWSTCYERAALSKIVDYVAVMTYDEHWRTAPKAGSTASLPWVRAALTRTLAEVPAEKLLLGIPLYTREWEETKNPSGKISLKSKALSMPSVDARIMEAKSLDRTNEKKWHPQAEQHYFQYVSDDKTYRIWVEDEHSILLRMNLVKEHKLAGAAFWRKGFEKPEIWDVVVECLEVDTKK